MCPAAKDCIVTYWVSEGEVTLVDIVSCIKFELMVGEKDAFVWLRFGLAANVTASALRSSATTTFIIGAHSSLLLFLDLSP